MSNQSDLAKSAAGFNGDPLSIDTANNRVGIGTTPSTNLHIKSSGDTQLWLDSSATSVSNRIVSLGQNGGAYKDLRYDAGQHLFRIGTTERMRIDSSGTTSFHGISGRATGSTGHLSISEQSNNRSYLESATTTTSNMNLMAFINPNGAIGSISVSGSSTSFNTSSDHRLKENVVELTGATERLKQLNPSRFNFIADADTTVDGFLAHEAQAVVPEAVTGTHNEVDDDGNPVYQGIDQSKLVPLLTAALKESIAKIEALEARVTALEGS